MHLCFARNTTSSLTDWQHHFAMDLLAIPFEFALEEFDFLQGRN
jgi:hypothetical protein